MEERTDGRMTDGHMDVQCETIIPATIVWRGIKRIRHKMIHVFYFFKQ